MAIYRILDSGKNAWLFRALEGIRLTDQRQGSVWNRHVNWDVGVNTVCADLWVS